MKKKREYKKIRVLILIILLAIIISSCGGGEKARKPSQDFSRGLPLASNATSAPAADIDPSGEFIHVAIPYEKAEGGMGFRYQQIQDGILIIDQDLTYDFSPFARSPKMIATKEGFHLFWATRKTTKEGWQLWHLMSNLEGDLTRSPHWISQGSERTSQFEVIDDSGGGVFALWEDSNEGDIRYTQLSSSGDVVTDSEILVEQGDRPSVTLDKNGKLHLVWMEEENLFYGTLNENNSLPLDGDRLYTIQINMGNRMDGPELETAGEDVYVSWSILRQSGLEAGTAITEYLVFPQNQIGKVKLDLITIYPESDDRFQPYEGELSLTEFVLRPTEDYLSTDFVYQPQMASDRNGNIIIGVAANQAIRLDYYIQLIVGVFKDGRYQGYTLATKTKALSQAPQMFIDNQGDIHLVWQEGSLGNQIYYTSTDSTVKANLDKVSLSDLPTFILSGGLEAITGILLFPFAIPWMAVGLVMMIAWRLIRNDEDVNLLPSKVILVIALISFQVSKMFFFPDVLIYIPFSAWLDIPDMTGMVLRYAVPILILAIGIGFAEYLRRRKESPQSSLSYYAAVILVDTFLTLAIYGVVFLGEF